MKKFENRSKYKNMFYISIFLNITIGFVFFLSLTAKNASTGNDWLVSIKTENGKSFYIKSNEFKEFYISMIDMTVLNNPLPVSTERVKALLKDEAQIKSALTTYINYRLILEDGEKHNVRKNLTNLKSRLKKLLYYIEQQMLINEYGKRVLLPEIKIQQSDYEPIIKSKQGKQIVEKYGKKTAIELIKERLVLRKLEKEFKDRIEDLKDASIIKYNDAALKKIIDE